MDLYCQKCGEPWDLYGVYNGDMTPEEKLLFLKGIECPSCSGKQVCQRESRCAECEDYESEKHSCRLNVVKRPFRATLARTMAGILGEDTDGLAAEMEDAEHLLGKEFWE